MPAMSATAPRQAMRYSSRSASAVEVWPDHHSQTSATTLPALSSATRPLLRPLMAQCGNHTRCAHCRQPVSRV